MKTFASVLLATCFTLSAVSSAAPITDNFTDGNYTANPSWTVHAGTWDVNGGELRQIANAAGNDTGTPRTIQLDGVVGGSSFTVQTDLRVDSPDAQFGVDAVGIAFRIQSATKMYVAYLFPDYVPTNGDLRVFKIDGASRTFVGTAQNMGFTPGETWSTMTLAVVDNAFTVTLVNGSNSFSHTFTDNTSPFTAGGVGLFSETYVANAIGLFDNVSVVAVPEPTSGTLAALVTCWTFVRRKRRISSTT